MRLPGPCGDPQNKTHTTAPQLSAKAPWGPQALRGDPCAASERHVADFAAPSGRKTCKATTARPRRSGVRNLTRRKGPEALAHGA